MNKEEISEYIKCAKDPVYFLNNYGFVFDITKKQVSKLKCFKYQEDVVYQMHREQNTIVLKSRQCIPENTSVDTPEGPKFIQDFKKGDQVYSYNFEENKIEIDIIKDAWCSGKIQCVKVILGNGKEIEVGENHPLYVEGKGWVGSKNLKIDEIVIDFDENLNKTESKIKEIIITEEKNCFDISVFRNENYLINGILVHNTGLSTVTAGYIAWKLIFNVDERILIVANDGAGAKRFLAAVKQYLDHVPAFLLPDERIVENTQRIEFSNGSWVKAVASGGNAGRGEALTMLVLDETAFIENADDIWMAAGIALSATGGKCVMISTPKGTGNLYHSTWVASKKGENDFSRFEIHWKDHPVFSKDSYIKMDENGREFLSSPWYEKECSRLQYNRVKIAQELDLSFEGSRALVVDNSIVERYESLLIGKKPLCYFNFRADTSNPGLINSLTDDEVFVKFETKFHVFALPRKDGNYIIGADVGRGDGSDYSTIQVIDADRLEQVAEYQAKLPPDEFAYVIHAAAVKYNNAYVAAECNSFGLATTLTLKNVIKYNPGRIYHSKSAKKIFNRTNEYFADQDSEIAGFQTTTKTRPLVISSVYKYMRDNLITINSSRLTDEFKTFIYNGDKAEHSAGFHDDLIFAFGIALLMRDTELSNIFNNKQMDVAILSSISHSSRSMNNLNTSGSKYNRNNVSGDDDLSWLYG